MTGRVIRLLAGGKEAALQALHVTGSHPGAGTSLSAREFASIPEMGKKESCSSVTAEGYVPACGTCEFF